MGDERHRKRSLFREVNERIRELNAASGAAADTYEVLCECSCMDCTRRVAVPSHVYEGVRTETDRFIVARDHDREPSERVFFEDEAYRVVRVRPPLRLSPAPAVPAPADLPAA